ncbi:MAG: hypothetical protein ACYTGC_01525 [Planctomycetota bacterium]
MIEEATGTRISEAEIEARVDEFTLRLIDLAEDTASSIILEGDDRAYRQNALIWMIRVNEEISRARVYDDPTAALIDMWVLSLQMRHYFESGIGKDWFGPHQQTVIDTCDQMTSQVRAIGADLVPDQIDDLGVTIEEWAVANPMDTRFMSRASTSSLLVSIQRRRGRRPFFSTEVLEERVGNIESRLEVLNSQLPKQLVWHVDLLLEDRMAELEVEQLAVDVQEAMDVIEDVPNIIEVQRDAIVEAIELQRTDLARDLDQQLVTALDNIDAQRTDTLDRVEATADRMIAEAGSIRDDAIATIDGGLTKALENIDRQRIETISQIDTLSDETLSRFEVAYAAGVDRAYTKLLLLLGIATVSGALLIVLAWYLKGRR